MSKLLKLIEDYWRAGFKAGFQDGKGRKREPDTSERSDKYLSEGCAILDKIKDIVKEMEATK